MVFVTPSSRKKILWAVVITIGVIIAVLGYQYQGAFVPIPETFTELYFENHNNLPKVMYIGKPNTFSFTIHNEEGKETEYQYRVYLIDELGREVDIATNNIVLADNESKTISESFVVMHKHTSEEVIVELIQRNQSIHFLMSDNN